MTDYDLVVIGAGIVGLAAAREILARHPDTRLAILDKEATIAAHQTGHNSGVIHTGIYYAPGSLKARLCVVGSRELYRFCAEHAVPTDRCGKLIVALDESERPALDGLYRRGTAIGVEGLELVGPERIREIEPHCAGVRAIWSPATGIVDYRRVAAAMADVIANAGGIIRTGTRVDGLSERGAIVTLETSQGAISAGRVIACAGLHADRVAALCGAPRSPAVVPFRGDYWQLRPDRRHLVQNLIYPVPDPRFPFLGIHFTRRIEDGSVLLGPNAVLAFAREGYRRRDIRARDLADSLADRGLQRLAARHWRMGAAEMYRDYSRRAFVAACRRFIPDLRSEDVVPGPSGVRAQSVSRDGRLVDDFVVHVQGPRLIHVRNAPSPAATSSLAIGRLIADEIDRVA